MEIMVEAELDDDEDDFMETYMAINAELKVQESQANRTLRNGGHSSSAHGESKASLYQSRLEVRSATNIIPFSKRQE